MTFFLIMPKWFQGMARSLKHVGQGLVVYLLLEIPTAFKA